MFIISLSFEPSKRDFKKNLKNINSVLDNLKLSSLEIKNNKGFVVKMKKYDTTRNVTLTNFDYGFDNIEFECKQEDGENLYIYQIDVVAFSIEKVLSPEEFVNQWKKAHPKRIVSSMNNLSYENSEVFILLHHEKIEG